MAIWPLCPGLAYQFNGTYNIAKGWVHLYQIGWLFAVFMSASVYVVLSYLFKDPAMFQARKSKWESYAANQKELLDRESEVESVFVETESQTSQQDPKKELGKTSGTVTVTWS